MWGGLHGYLAVLDALARRYGVTVDVVGLGIQTARRRAVPLRLVSLMLLDRAEEGSGPRTGTDDEDVLASVTQYANRRLADEAEGGVQLDSAPPRHRVDGPFERSEQRVVAVLHRRGRLDVPR